MKKHLYKIKRAACQTIIKFKFCRMALVKINEPHIGRIAGHNSELCELRQGCYSGGVWDMTGLETKADYKRVPPSEFQIKHPFADKRKAFKFNYKFLMSNWFKIYVGRLMDGNRKDAWKEIVGHSWNFNR